MRIDKENDEVAMVLSRQDMVELKEFLDLHLMIPKVTSNYSNISTASHSPIMTTSNHGFSYPQPNQWQVVKETPTDPTKTWDIFGKLIRALDLIVDNKEVSKNE